MLQTGYIIGICFSLVCNMHSVALKAHSYVFIVLDVNILDVPCSPIKASTKSHTDHLRSNECKIVWEVKVPLHILKADQFLTVRKS